MSPAPSRTSTRACVAVLCCLALALSACSFPGDSSAAESSPGRLAPFYQQAIQWGSCGDGFECATLTVPLDYQRPTRDRIELALIRKPAGNPDRRVGSLVLNPGGPGASGVQYARAADTVVAPAVRERFDVVGFDPRGVGQSAGVQCVTDRRLDEFLALDASPEDPGEREALARASRDFGAGCEQRSGRVLPHVGTANAARDMDILRAALGDDGLTYLGKSYGTELGATYAELFPQRVRALVLDGAVDPTLTWQQSNLAQAKGFETALRSFVAGCVDQPGCPLGTAGVEAALDRFERLFTTIDENPLPTSQGDRRLTQALARYGVAAALYNERYWPRLRRALAQARSGEGTGLLQLADALAGRQPDGSYTNLMEASTAINCVDEQTPDRVSAYARAARQARQEAPHFGPYVAWSSLPCATWPADPDKQPEIDAAGAKPILVIGTTRDPATPYAWAEALAGQLDSGVLLTREGDGHTAYRAGNDCIDRAVNRYVIGGEVPEAGKRCG